MGTIPSRDKWLFSLVMLALAGGLALSYGVLPRLYPAYPSRPLFFFLPSIGAGGAAKDGAQFATSTSANTLATSTNSTKGDSAPKPIVVVHLSTPVPLKGIYMSSWIAGTKPMRQKVVKLMEETKVNAVVVDIKDATGQIAFSVDDPYLKSMGSESRRIPDIVEFIDELHKKGIYVIGRIAVFQDPLLSAKKPSLAVKRADTVTLWRDHKGIGWLDAGEKEVWKYVVAIARESYKKGFDELNFDYIRFPSDGDMNDIYYPVSEGKERAPVVRSFFAYLNKELVGTSTMPRPKISGDLFGMTTTNKGDLNIGQRLEDALPYFDYVLPMVYPSHFPPEFIGLKNPAAEPYKVIRYSMDRAVEKALAASSTPSKLRPWLQDFDLGATYTAQMVQAQMQATYDAGLTSWILWDPNVRYTKEALMKDSQGILTATTTGQTP